MTNTEKTNNSNTAITTSSSSTQPSLNIQTVSVCDYLNAKFDSDIANFASQINRKTGFTRLDIEIKSLYQGLYVLGAVSSLGKTTFVHQMCDNMAKAGEHILYFSFEQSDFELVSKSIVRELHEARSQSIDSKFPGYSAMEIRSGAGQGDPRVQEVIEKYKESIGDRFTIVSASFSMNVEQICTHIRSYIEDHGVTPIVVVDYLQVVEKTMIGMNTMDTRSATDHVVKTLKCLQLELGLVVILISSLNRMNYLTTIDYECFKESGGIEYTADVIWGLELKVMHKDIFDKQGRLNEKRDLIKEEKAKNPRDISLKCLKNRFGSIKFDVQFKYYPGRETFICN